MSVIPGDDAVLDDAGALAAADPDGLLRATATAGAQVRESLQVAREVRLGEALAGLRPRSVLLCTDPAASAAPDVLAALAARTEAAAPVVAWSEPVLPLWAGALDLVVAVSAAGSDERVQAVADSACRRGVPLIGVGRSPSPLEAVCSRGRASYLPVPEGRSSRAALWSVLAPVLLAAGAVGVLSDVEVDLDTAADRLDVAAERSRPGSDLVGNPAKSLAVEIGQSLPVVWGTSALAGAAAVRFAAHVAEVAALAAVAGRLPDDVGIGGVLGAGTVDGLQDDLFRDRVDEPAPRRPGLLLLRDVVEEPAVRMLATSVVQDAGRRGVRVMELTAEGDGPVTRLASLLGILDFASVYVALASGVDPSAPRLGQAPP